MDYLKIFLVKCKNHRGWGRTWFRNIAYKNDSCDVKSGLATSLKPSHVYLLHRPVYDGHVEEVPVLLRDPVQFPLPAAQLGSPTEYHVEIIYFK